MTSTDALTSTECDRLKALEAVIGASQRAWIETARSLRTIRDERLFRGHYATIGEYAETRHQIKRSRAHRLVRAANTYDALEAAAVERLPLNESQIRAFAPLSGGEAVQAWNHALHLAGSPDPTMTTRSPGWRPESSNDRRRAGANARATAVS